MILPSTRGAALLLCLMVFVSLGSWVLCWRLGAKRWRFELFTIDFAIGAVLFALASAFTLGTMGSELAFTDSLMVSSHTAQAFVLASGLTIGLGNVALIASVSLLGVSGAFPVAGGVFALILGFASARVHPAALAISTVFSLAGVALIILAMRRREAVRENVAPAAANRSVPRKPPTLKGILLGVLAGMLFAASQALARTGTSGELGLAPYASLVFFSIAALLSTMSVIFFLFNFPVDGPPVHLTTYLASKPQQHTMGALAGMLWGVGALGCFLLRGMPAISATQKSLNLQAALASFLLPMAWGALMLREQAWRSPGSSRVVLALGAAALAVGFYVVGATVVS